MSDLNAYAALEAHEEEKRRAAAEPASEAQSSFRYQDLKQGPGAAQEQLATHEQLADQPEKPAQEPSAQDQLAAHEEAELARMKASGRYESWEMASYLNHEQWETPEAYEKRVARDNATIAAKSAGSDLNAYIDTGKTPDGLEPEPQQPGQGLTR